MIVKSWAAKWGKTLEGMNSRFGFWNPVTDESESVQVSPDSRVTVFVVENGSGISDAVYNLLDSKGVKMENIEVINLKEVQMEGIYRVIVRPLEKGD